METDTRLIPRQDQPENLESPRAIFDSFLTPASLFYIRNHFNVPALDRSGWQLRIEGAVERPLVFNYKDLLELPSQTIIATLECAGNSRTFLPRRSKGVQWDVGAVGTAEWTGVPLSVILDLAQCEPNALEVILEGADHGAIEEAPATPGIIPYSRSLPLSKALSAEVLLAYRMNSEELPPRHGFPLRVLVPGWYGMASVKWLKRITVTTAPFAGYFQTFEYSRWYRNNGNPSLYPLSAGEVKAEIAQPVSGEVVPLDSSYRIHGAAWAGESEVSEVELSFDAGRSWNPTQLLDTPRRYCWVRWQYNWNTPGQTSTVELMARASDTSGRSQPFSHFEDERHYSIHHVLPVRVQVGKT